MKQMIVYLLMSIAVEIILVLACIELEFPLLWLMPITWAVIALVGLTDVPRD